MIDGMAQFPKMQIPEGVNAYKGLVELAATDEIARLCLDLLHKSMREEKVFEHAFETIGDLVIRFSYAAADGLTLDFEGCEPKTEAFIHKLADIYERWNSKIEALG